MKRVIGAVVVVAAIAVSAVVLARPAGPNVDTGSNPIRSFWFEPSPVTKIVLKEVYTVPKGHIFVLTDLVVTPTQGMSGGSKAITRGCVLANSERVVCLATLHGAYQGGAMTGQQHAAFASGIRFESGTKLALKNEKIGSAYATITISGYLARP